VKFHKPMMETAQVWANQSYCKRKKVGAVIAKDNRIISIGYNGTVQGAENCCEDDINNGPCLTCNSTGKIKENNIEIACNACLGLGSIWSTKTKPSVVHAEANAILFACKNGISTEGCSLYITLSPCIECAKMIVQSGIKEVYFHEEYRNTDAIDFFKKYNVKVEHLRTL
jgi:dCMP deaminase